MISNQAHTPTHAIAQAERDHQHDTPGARGKRTGAHKVGEVKSAYVYIVLPAMPLTQYVLYRETNSSEKKTCYMVVSLWVATAAYTHAPPLACCCVIRHGKETKLKETNWDRGKTAEDRRRQQESRAETGTEAKKSMKESEKTTTRPATLYRTDQTNKYPDQQKKKRLN